MPERGGSADNGSREGRGEVGRGGALLVRGKVREGEERG